MENFKPENNKQPSEEKPQGLKNPEFEETLKLIYDLQIRFSQDFSAFSQQMIDVFPHYNEILSHPEKYDREEVEACEKMRDEYRQRAEANARILNHLREQLDGLKKQMEEFREKLLGGLDDQGDKKPESTEGFVVKKDMSDLDKFNQN
jgi:hypothetical protein